MTETSFWDLSWSGWAGAVVAGVVTVLAALLVMRRTLENDRESARAQRDADRTLALEQREADRELAAQQSAESRRLAQEDRAHVSAARMHAAVREVMVTARYAAIPDGPDTPRERLQSICDSFDAVLVEHLPPIRDAAIESGVMIFRTALIEYREWFVKECDLSAAWTTRPDLISQQLHVHLSDAYRWLNDQALLTSVMLHGWRSDETWTVPPEPRALAEVVPHIPAPPPVAGG